MTEQSGGENGGVKRLKGGSELLKVQQEIEKTTVEITEVENKIAKVEKDIEEAQEKIKNPDDRGRDYWENEKKELRQKEDHLRKEKEQLRDQKKLFLERTPRMNASVSHPWDGFDLKHEQKECLDSIGFEVHDRWTRFLQTNSEKEAVQVITERVDEENPKRPLLQTWILKEALHVSEELSTHLFISRDDVGILRQACESETVAIVGSPGTGKSFLQFKYLMFLLQPGLFAEYWGESLAFQPEIVVRIVDESWCQVFFIKERIVLESVVTSLQVQQLMKWFPLCLWESRTSKDAVPALESPERGRVWISTSPNIVRYRKTLEENHGTKLYMRSNCLEDILAMGEHFLKIRSDLNADEILRRYNYYGPYIRTTFTNNLENFTESRNLALQEFEPDQWFKLLITNSNIEYRQAKGMPESKDTRKRWILTHCAHPDFPDDYKKY